MKFALVKTPLVVKKMFPNYVWDMATDEQIIYLTFDDGPTPDITEWTLKTLEQFNAKATFFCIGSNVEKHPEIFQKILKNGHSVGNHTHNHIKGWKTSTENYVANVLYAQNIINVNNQIPNSKFQIPNSKFQIPEDTDIDSEINNIQSSTLASTPLSHPNQQSSITASTPLSHQSQQSSITASTPLSHQSHSFDSLRLRSVNAAQLPKSQLRLTSTPLSDRRSATVIKNQQSTINNLFRPPYGQLKNKQGKALRKLGYNIIMWDVIAFDWEADISSEKCLNNVLTKTENGSIVVLHDSVKASKHLQYVLPKVLQYFSEKGFVFRAIE